MPSIAIISVQAFSLVNFRGLLIRALKDRGVSVYALAPDFNDELRTRVTELGATPVDYSLSRTGMNPFRDVTDVFRLLQLLKRLKPDVALNCYIKPVIYGSIAARLARIPKRFSMIEGMGYVFLDDPKSLTWRRRTLRWAVYRLYKLALGLNQKVFILNKDDIAQLVEGGIVDERRVSKIDGIGLDLDYYTPMPSVVIPVTFIMIARMLREKGVYEFVEAARQVRERYAAVRFLLVGETDTGPGFLTETELRSWVGEGLVDWPGARFVLPWLLLGLVAEAVFQSVSVSSFSPLRGYFQGLSDGVARRIKCYQDDKN